VQQVLLKDAFDSVPSLGIFNKFAKKGMPSYLKEARVLNSF
jgi:hypothetical protein